MSYLRYLKVCFGCLCFGVVLIAGTNFVVDPGSIYLNPLVTDYKIESYVDLIKSSRYGVLKESWNERQVKAQFAKTLDQADCVVIGSSHVRSISKVRDEAGHLARCAGLANLGVPGASFEDVLIYLYLVARHNPEGKQIFIGIDPWVFGFNKDARWKIHQTEYREALSYFGLQKEAAQGQNMAGFSFDRLSNLLNYEYFVVSIRELFDNGLVTTFRNRWEMLEGLGVDRFAAPQVDFDRGHTSKLFLSDGSFLYDQDYIAKSKFKSRKDGGFKLRGRGDIDPVAYKSMIKVAMALHDLGHQVSFLFTPYHHEVLEDPGSLSRAVMAQIASLIEKHRAQLPIKTYGSYNPEHLDCTRNEFYDYMHPKTPCVNRVFKQAGIPVI
ncbi:MAG: hypothetical protein C9356_11655 [Oleiphilus sp.]|nr:MAG: hypothetical protein C9356_11655 [Oleiphilus sp.]